MSEQKTPEEKLEELSLREFLENIPPGVDCCIKSLTSERTGNKIVKSDIFLHCPTPQCAGNRFYQPLDVGLASHNDSYSYTFVRFVCRNCRTSTKSYAIRVDGSPSASGWVVRKIGEIPTFGPPTPGKTLRLIEKDKDLFLKGRACENQGFGIAAFSYYRRVIENQKDAIFDKIIRVVDQTTTDQDLLQELTAAKGDIRFTAAVEKIRKALPQSLMINGYNPLTLLHDALSEGLHSLSDTECLQLASDIREVLVEFAEKLSAALREDAELKSAIGRLTNRKAAKPPNGD